MATIKGEYKSFLDDIEKNIKDKEDLEYIKKRFTSFIDIMLEQMDSILEYKKEEFEKLENAQKQIEERIDKMGSVLDNIEKDIYSDEGFDFEIICPYCNNEFFIDADEDKTEIQCPECKNIIELDWTGNIDEEENKQGCPGNCTGCQYHNEEEKDEDDDM